MPTREAIVGKLAKERAALVARYRRFERDGELDTIATESEVPGADPWRTKDHLAHIAMIEWSFQGMIRRFIAGEQRPVRLESRGQEGAPRQTGIASVHTNNQRNVEAHRDDELGTLLADLEKARADSLALLAELTDEQLDLAVPGAPWGGGTIGGILITNGYHDVQHTRWVEEGLAARAAES